MLIFWLAMYAYCIAASVALGLHGGWSILFRLNLVIYLPAAMINYVPALTLTEVPVMLILVKIANNTKHWFPVRK